MFKSIKSDLQVAEQLQQTYYAELDATRLLEEEYQEISWEEWAHCFVELGHRPTCIAAGESGYTVVRDGFTSRIIDSMRAAHSN